MCYFIFNYRVENWKKKKNLFHFRLIEPKAPWGQMSSNRIWLLKLEKTIFVYFCWLCRDKNQAEQGTHTHSDTELEVDR